MGWVLVMEGAGSLGVWLLYASQFCCLDVQFLQKKIARRGQYITLEYTVDVFERMRMADAQ